MLATGEVESKDRVCVVMRAEHDYVMIVYGQGKAGLCNRLLVKPDSPDGKRLELSKDTYFREDAVKWVLVARLRKHVGRVSQDLYIELDAIVEDALANMRVPAHPAQVTPVAPVQSGATTEQQDPE